MAATRSDDWLLMVLRLLDRDRRDPIPVHEWTDIVCMHQRAANNRLRAELAVRGVDFRDAYVIVRKGTKRGYARGPRLRCILEQLASCSQEA